MNSMIPLLTIKRILKLGLTNFWRNRWLSLAASLMIMLTLVTMGIFVLLSLFANSTAEGIKDRIDLTVYFYENATDAQIKDLEYQLSNRADVKKLTYVSKEQALTDWQHRPVNQKVKDLITADENPLPRSLQIQATDPAALNALAKIVSADQYKPYIRQVSYEQTRIAIDKLIRLTGFIRRSGLTLTTFLLVISLIVIMNTIRLTIFTRRDEIEIMRLVGANSSFIRVPFAVEAVLYGAFGALLAYASICVMMGSLGGRLAGYFADVASSSATPYFYLIQPYFEASSTHPINFFSSLLILWQLGLVQVLIGVLFGVICSFIALRRYLRI